MDELRQSDMDKAREIEIVQLALEGEKQKHQLTKDAAATAEAECVFLAPAALAAAKQALASLYAERLAALAAVLESATAVRDAIRAGAPLPVADDAPVVERVWEDDDGDDEEEEGRKRKKKRKKKR